jgi:streptomycin 6-kinase
MTVINDREKIAYLEKKFNFRFLLPFSSMTHHFIGCVESLNTNKKYVVKLGRNLNDLNREVETLRAYLAGCVKIIDYQPDDLLLMLEFIEPGTPLSQIVRSGNDEAATRIIANKIIELHENFDESSKAKLPHLSSLKKDILVLKDRIENAQFTQLERKFFELTETRSTDVVLHGDLHHDNILKNGASWIAIDPHGYVGDATYDVGAMIYNPFFIFENIQNLNQIVNSRIVILAEELKVEYRHILDWAYCKCLLSAAWEVEDLGRLPQIRIDIADILLKFERNTD